MSAKHQPICPYCNRPAQLVSGEEIYPHRSDLEFLKFWLCHDCWAYVGCHREGAWIETKSGRITSDGTLPLGRLANDELRSAKSRAHSAIDVFWQYESNKQKARRAVYRRLADHLGIDVYDCHIGMFDVPQCKEVVRIANLWASDEIRGRSSGVRS